jgi:hypothetical protein
MELIYDKKTEINFLQYTKLKTQAKGIVCAKKEGDKFFFKIWVMSGSKFVADLLRQGA